jgi:hypothetical protein
MTERDWVGELQRWLQDSFAELCPTIGQAVPLSGLRVNPPLGKEEAQYFLLGLEEGLFALDEQGYVQSELLSASLHARTEQNSYRLFSHEPTAPRLLRENVCQLATASRLILKRGWLKRHVALEPSSKEHRATALGVDLLVRSATGKILIWVEVKRSAVELQKLVADLRACSRRGPHAREDCGFPQNHPRYEFWVSYKPTYLWAVAPDAEIAFKMEDDHGRLERTELTSLPPRSLIELE